MKKCLILLVFISNANLFAANFTIKSHLGGGFFCEFGKVIKSLIHHEQDGIKSMHIDWTSQFFPFKDAPDENGWDLYFEPILTEDEKSSDQEPVYNIDACQTHDLHDQLCVAQWLLYDEYLPYRQFVHEKINKYIKIKPHILEQVEQFHQQYMAECLCIGVHVRYASLHEHETPKGHPALEDYCVEVNILLDTYKDRNTKVFLASDSHTVINYFQARYGDKLIYIDTYRAKDKEDPGLIYGNQTFWISHPDLWNKVRPGYKAGLGALMDCLLLSKCDYLIHITSNVSTYACFFNPYIKSIYLPRDVPFAHCRFRGDQTIRNKFLNPI